MSSCPPSHSSFCTRWNLRVNPNHHPAAPQTISASDPPQLGPWLGKVTSSAGLVRGQDPPFPAMQVPLTPLKSQDSTIFMIFLPPPHVCACSVTSVLSNSLWPYGLLPTRLLCSQDSSGKNTTVVCPFPSPGDLPDPGIKPNISSVSCIGKQVLYQLSQMEAPEQYLCKSESHTDSAWTHKQKEKKSVLLLLEWLAAIKTGDREKDREKESMP